MYDFMTLFLLAMDWILDNASDSDMGGCKLSGLDERMLDGTVDLTSDSKELNPMDWSINLVSSSFGPTDVLYDDYLVTC